MRFDKLPFLEKRIKFIWQHLTLLNTTVFCVYDGGLVEINLIIKKTTPFLRLLSCFISLRSDTNV